MPTLAPALSLEAEANMARAAADICRAWLDYERALRICVVTVSECARLKAAAQSLERDWHQARHGYKWEDYCEPDQLAALRRLEQM